MNHTSNHHRRALSLAVCTAFAFLPLAACTKKEAAGEKKEEKSEKKDENLVTLTKENLEHTKIEAQPAALGSLEVTLKAAGRVSENLNKTAKVVSTLEGRPTARISTCSFSIPAARCSKAPPSPTRQTRTHFAIPHCSPPAKLRRARLSKSPFTMRRNRRANSRRDREPHGDVRPAIRARGFRVARRE